MNEEFDGLEIHINQNLCNSCRYMEKCRRFMLIQSIAQEIESKAFEDWEMDVFIIAIVNECKRYKVYFGGEEFDR